MIINSEKFKKDLNNKIENYPSNIVKANFIEWMIYFNRENLFITLFLNIWENVSKLFEGFTFLVLNLFFFLTFPISFPVLYFIRYKIAIKRNKKIIK